jgi:tetratricopeptide (TPR) repeat protein
MAPRGSKVKTSTASQRLEKKLQERRDEKISAEKAEDMKVVEELKAEGNALFAAGDNLGAVEKFTECIELDESNHVFFSNRSAANLNLKRTRDAVADAQECTNLKRDWPKGWSRLGAALLADGQASSACAAYKTGLKLDPDSEPMQQGLKLAEEAAKEEESAKAEEKEQKAGEGYPAEEVEPVIGIDLGTTIS